MNNQKIFVVAGMPRVGTTFLYHFLQQHPEIVLPATKELNFFSLHHEKGLDHYFSLFPADRGSRWTGDISPIYFMDADAPARIRKALPGVRVILGVRQPTDWVISFHNQLKHHSRRPPLLEEMCTGFRWEVEDRTLPVSITPGFVEKQLQVYSEAFGDDLLIYTHEFLKQDPLGLLNTLESFLGLPRFFEAANFRNQYINASGRKNFRWMSYLLRQPMAAVAIRRVFPESTIRKVRGMMESMVAPKSLPSEPRENAGRQAVSQVLGVDDERVKAFFSGRRSMSGTQFQEIARTGRPSSRSMP